ncbi:hypothetical protein K2173_017503 [Erythroxylum novogranatense]|uniref:DUF4283 domain-containing protein n=1 Tax=Erythroxylum novogranatense TaxID=1862640 RepID=A0AAV8TNH6_9ROSI|nr:hypothetical protein K2173_017503 [Erythroxylum novogranatense]
MFDMQQISPTLFNIKKDKKTLNKALMNSDAANDRSTVSPPKERDRSTKEVDLIDRHTKKLKALACAPREAMETATSTSTQAPATVEDGAMEIDTSISTPTLATVEDGEVDTLLRGRHQRQGLEAVSVEATILVGDEEPITVSLKGPKPSIRLSEKIMERIYRPFQRSLILKPLGRSVGFLTLKDRLRRLWHIPEDTYDLIDLNDGYFLVEFDLEDDYRFVLEEGPWLVLGHYLTVQKWQPNFWPSTDVIQTTAVWVNFPDCPMEFYNEAVLMAAWELIGKPLKVDATTLNSRSGHRKEACPYTTKLASDQLPTAEVTVGASLPFPPVAQVDLHCADHPPFGPWMLPTRQNHRRPTGKAKKGGPTVDSRNPPSRSRYNVLAAMEGGLSADPVLDGVALPSGGGRTDIPPTMAPDMGGVALPRSSPLSLQPHTISNRRANRKHLTPPVLGSIRLSHVRG